MPRSTILAGIIVNLIIVYAVLRSSSWLERVCRQVRIRSAPAGEIFGVILLAIAVKIFKDNVRFG